MQDKLFPQKKATGSLIDQARAQADAKIWKPTKINDGIEGTVTAIRRGGKFDSVFYYLQTDKETVIVAGGNTVLGQKIADLNVQVGDAIGVVFLGEGKTKSGTVFKNWSVVCQKPLPNAGTPPSDDDIPF